LKRFEENRFHGVLSLLEKGERLLDVGCGNGDFCVMTKGLFSDVCGIDVSPVRITNAEEKISTRQDKKNFHFVQHDVDESLPFPDDFFDAVTCIATLEYIVCPSRVIMEMRRVLKPRGCIIVQVANIAFLPCRFTLLSGKLPTLGGIDAIGVDWERLHSFTKQVIVRFLMSRGFDVVDLSCSGIFPRTRRLWLSLLASDIIVKAMKSNSKHKGQNVTHCSG